MTKQLHKLFRLLRGSTKNITRDINGLKKRLGAADRTDAIEDAARRKFMNVINLRVFRLPFLTSILILTLFLNGCSESQNKKTITVGVCIADFNNKFLSYIKNEMEKYQSELGDDIEVQYFDATEDLQKQEQQVIYLLEKKVDVLVVIPVNTKHTKKITDMARKAKTPIIYLHRYPEEFLNKELPKNVYYIGVDEKVAGLMQMEYLAEKLDGKGNIAILMGNLSNRAAFDRTSGIEEVADKYPGIKIVKKESAKWLKP